MPPPDETKRRQAGRVIRADGTADRSSGALGVSNGVFMPRMSNLDLRTVTGRGGDDVRNTNGSVRITVPEDYSARPLGSCYSDSELAPVWRPEQTLGTSRSGRLFPIMADGWWGGPSKPDPG